MRVLYLSYDGALDPLGASQVLPYVQGLAARGHSLELITFEKPARWAVEAAVSELQARLDGSNVLWHPLRYHRRPSALGTAYDLYAGLRRARALHAERPFDLVHVRSYPCATIALALKRSFSVPYLFDMRGFYPEERVDGRVWSRTGPLFSTAKRLERDFLSNADAVVTLTHASVPSLRALMDQVRSRASLDVIPTAVDLNRFVPHPRVDPPRLVYLGSLGTWYRADAMVELARHWLALNDSVIVDFLVNGDSSDLLNSVASFPKDRVRVGSVAHADVPAAMAGAWATFAVIDPAPSKIASAPTKIGESLAAGLPVLVNRGVGDVADWVEKERIGVVLEDFEPMGYRQAATDLLERATDPDIARRCRTFAERELSLESAVSRYDAIYSAVASRAPGRVHA